MPCKTQGLYTGTTIMFFFLQHYRKIHSNYTLKNTFLSMFQNNLEGLLFTLSAYVYNAPALRAWHTLIYP